MFDVCCANVAGVMLGVSVPWGILRGMIKRVAAKAWTAASCKSYLTRRLAVEAWCCHDAHHTGHIFPQNERHFEGEEGAWPSAQM